MSDYTELCARLRDPLSAKLLVTAPTRALFKEAADALESQAREIAELTERVEGLLREVVEVVAACHNCLSYEAPELADRVDAALGEKP